MRTPKRLSENTLSRFNKKDRELYFKLWDIYNNIDIKENYKDIIEQSFKSNKSNQFLGFSIVHKIAERV